MSLTSSLYEGITGLKAHSEAISVIGNNLANVSTTAYKASNTYFEDLVSQNVATGSGNSQEGLGVEVAAIYSDFSQGSIETTDSSTDLALDGSGFFCVKSTSDDETYYTRDGNFTFNNAGYLVDANGNRVQGWAMEKESTSTDYSIYGTAGDIQVSDFQSPASATTSVSLITNLDPTSESQCDNSTNPYFAMFEDWDGEDETPLDSSSYEYSSTIKVYDDTGTSHNLTVYYDKVTMSSNAGSDTVWEYMVTCEPDEDGRSLSGTSLKNTSAAGVLMIGTLTFNSGNLVGESAYTLKSNASGDMKNLNNWTLADFSTSGYPTFTANFTSASNASATNSAEAETISLNLGMRSKDNTWTQSTGTLNETAASLGSDVSTANILPTMGDDIVNSLSTESYNTGDSTLSDSQDGYTAGTLESVSVDKNGVLSGTFSNGQEIPLYTVEVASFANEWGLKRDGSNLYSATVSSGAALTGTANSAGKGSITSEALESSNVDMSTEFVNLITAQRGFEANTKVITTSDSLLSEVISMKR